MTFLFQHLPDGPELEPLGQEVQKQQQGISVDCVDKAGVLHPQNPQHFLRDGLRRYLSGFHLSYNPPEAGRVAGVELRMLTKTIQRVGGDTQHSRIHRARAENANGDTQQLQIPITIPLLLGFFIAIYAFKAPDSSLVLWGSMIPFTSPIVMLARLPFGVPVWQILLSVVLLVATTGVLAWASAKIYRVGILMFGKKTTWKDLWKWFKQD